MHTRTRSLITAGALLFSSLGNVSYANEALFFVNEPQDLDFVSMGRVATHLEEYYARRGITQPEDVDRFYSIIGSHGAPEAGTRDSEVALVVQDATYAGNDRGIARGVLVIKGRFEKERVLEMMEKNYAEHLSRTDHAPQVRHSEIEPGREVHTFVLPEKDRALVMQSVGNYTFVSSAADGDTGLLDRTVSAVVEGRVSAKPRGTSAVHYSLVLTDEDRVRLKEQMHRKYERYKEERLRTSKRKGLMKWFSSKIADHKVKFIDSAIDDSKVVDVTIYREKDETLGMNQKRMRVKSTFQDERTARRVKRKLLKHLNGLVKGAADPGESASLGSNIRVRAEGDTCTVDCDLATEEEQMHAFALISSYAAKSMLKK